ncbi:(2Fe-2S)-binding protein [Thermohalobacter berrensis]|uniref:(2Fe-2S)-binding protein n=1 Tax=Thermohalobacter berrensis TaxID=99594 RepID=UPI00242C4A1E|nr:2Fe-2S iron-sulfur cluster-binding protein [Thermohalobacter berrensis]
MNKKEYMLEIKEDTRLIDLLRDVLGFTGVKEGCGEGECGACTVIMDGDIVNSCLVLAFQADGKEIITIEGVESEEEIHPIQQAFLDVGAVQCGFCTPGMILSAKALLDKNPSPTREEIRAAISGNLCRCTGYNKIVDAIERAALYLKRGK